MPAFGARFWSVAQESVLRESDLLFETFFGEVLFVVPNVYDAL